MTYEQAKRITGNQPIWALRNMIKALSMMSVINTPEENKRLKAAKIVLRNKNKRS